MQIGQRAQNFRRASWLVALALWTGAAVQAQTLAEPRNVVQLSSNGSVEVQQDWLVLHLSASREGASAAEVQKQLQKIVDAAMPKLRAQVADEQMQLVSGAFGVYPRHNRDGKIASWQGSAELVLQGRDFARITQAAAQAGEMAIAQIGFGLSKQAEAKVQDQAQSEAIAAFKAKAQQLAKEFGFSKYRLREVAVNSNDLQPRMQAMAASGRSAMSKAGESYDAVPVEAGKAKVTVNVSGSVQLE